jgi:hypothetical protein
MPPSLDDYAKTIRPENLAQAKKFSCRSGKLKITYVKLQKRTAILGQ